MQPKTFLQSIAAPFRQFIRNESSSGILLILSTMVAMLWANSPLAPGYFDLWDTPVSISIGEDRFSKPLLLWVNDGLMAIFFFTIGLEIKKEVIDGELSTPRKAALPLLALANAGIKFGGGGEVFSQPLFMNIVVALLFGKVIGIVLFSWLAVKLRIADLPLRTGWVQMVGLGLLGGIGFTMALFISNLALEAPALLTQAKLGILIGSIVAASSGYLLLHYSLREALEEEVESVDASG